MKYDNRKVLAPPPEQLERVTVRADGRLACIDLANGGEELVGTWQRLPASRELLILYRDQPGPAERDIKLAGVIDSPGTVMSMVNMLKLNQETASLHIVSGEAYRIFYIQRGQLLAARSNLGADRLGELLVQSGVLDAATRDRYLEGVTSSNQLGRELVHRGVLSTHEVYEWIRVQSERIFHSVLFLERGCFFLVKPLDMNDVPAMLHLDLQQLMLEGLRRNDELENLRETIPRFDVVLIAGRKEPPSSMSAEAVQLLRYVDGQSPLDQAAARCGFDELTATNAAAALVQHGVAEVLAADSLRRPTSAPIADVDRHEAIAAIYADAMHALFAAVAPELRVDLAANVRVFMNANREFADALGGVLIRDDGVVVRERLGTGPVTADRAEMLERGMSDLLFFLLFEVSHMVAPKAVLAVQRDVAAALSRLRRAE